MEKYQNLRKLIEQASVSQIQGQNNLIFTNLRINIQNMSQQMALIIYDKINDRKNTNSKKNWHFDEIKLLIYIAIKQSYLCKTNMELLSLQSWNKISSYFPDRLSSQCMFKALSMKRKSVSQYPWQKIQNEIFESLLNEIGFQWIQISKQLFLRSPIKIYRNSKQCREHYLCFYKSNIKKGIWSYDEDYKLACSYLQFGRKWSKISKTIEGRSQNAIKNRFCLLFEGYKQKKIAKTLSMTQKISLFIKKYENSNANIANNEKSPIKENEQITIQQNENLLNVKIKSNCQISSNSGIEKQTKKHHENLSEKKQLHLQNQTEIIFNNNDMYGQILNSQWEDSNNLFQFFKLV